MAQVVWRTEVMEVKTSPVLHRLCFQSKNLYNRAMFLFKQFYKKTCKNMSYQQLDRKLKTEVCYRILPAQTAQQTLKILTRNWKSFFQALKEYRINSNEFLGKPRQPKYKTKNGQQVAIFTNQQVKIRNKQIIFPKKVPFKLKTRLSDFIQLKEVRIIPRGCGYSVEIVYSKLIPER